MRIKTFDVRTGEFTEREMTAEEMTAEITAMESEARKAELSEKSRPLTEIEISRLFITQNIQTIITDDATASRAVEFHPVLRQDKVQTADTPLVRAGTRVRWGNGLKKAAVDLWDTEANNPENSPTLWADLAYRNGFRIIDEVLTVTTAFSNGELGWWGDVLYKSKKDANVYNPTVRPEDWEEVANG